MFQKLLICSDGSDNALDAAQLGVVLAKHLGAEALALQVCEAPSLVFTQAGPGSVIASREITEEYVRIQAQLHQERMHPLLEGTGVSFRILQETGHPMGGIVHVAEREHVNLIVMGSRGLHGIKEFFLGSVSRGVLHHAPCSVLVVRGKNAPLATKEFRHILLVSDGSEGAGKAAVAAVEIADRFATSLTVLNVVEPFASIPIDKAEINGLPVELNSDAVACRLRRIVEDSVKQIAEPEGVYCSFHQERGQAEETIVGFADWHHADLIVMGSRGLGGFGRLLLGSVSNAVAHHADCPVLIVR